MTPRDKAQRRAVIRMGADHNEMVTSDGQTIPLVPKPEPKAPRLDRDQRFDRDMLVVTVCEALGLSVASDTTTPPPAGA